MLKLIILMMVIGGYALEFNNRFNINRDFVWILATSFIGLALFYFGLLNILNVGLYLVIISGILFLAYNIYKLFKSKKKIEVSLSLLFLLAVTIFLYIWLSPVKYYSYDNFSHWGIVIKTIYYNNRFPNMADKIIAFQSYPLGASVFDWFVIKIIGYSEGHILFGQSILYTCALLPLFSVLNKEFKIKQLPVYIIIIISFFCILTYGAKYENGINNLLVDSLLAYLGAASIIMAIYYKDDYKKLLMCDIPVLSFCITVKNSAIMWIFVAALMLVIIGIEQKLKFKEILFKTIYVIIIPIITRILWKIHVKTSFISAETSSHSMSISYFKMILKDKTATDIAEISRLFISKVFSLNNQIIIVIGVMIISIIVLLITKNKDSSKQMIKYTVFLIVVYVVYQIGNYFMYIFSMPLVECYSLAGYERYAMTIDLFTLICTVYFNLSIVCKENNAVINFIIYICLLYCISKFTSGISTLYQRKELSLKNEMRLKLDDIVDSYDIEQNQDNSYLVYISDMDFSNGYYGCMSGYVLYSNNVNVITSVEELSELYSNYDSLVILKHDDLIDEWLLNFNYSSSLDFILLN